MPKLSLLLTFLLASLSVSGAATPNKINKRVVTPSWGIFDGSRPIYSFSQIRGRVNPINHLSDQIKCGDITYGPDDFERTALHFRTLKSRLYLRTLKHEVKQFFMPSEDVQENRYIGIDDKSYIYWFPLIKGDLFFKGGKYLKDERKKRDFVILAKYPAVVVEVLTTNKMGDLVPCVKVQQGQ